MSFINQRGIKNLFVVVVLVIASALIAIAQNDTKAPADNTNFVAVVAKVLSIDPIKGDVSVRLEFEPHGKLVKDDGTLAKSLKLDINSSNGKQEVSFDKGKKMTPTEAVLNMYDSAVSDYPFDKHKADLIFWFSVKPDKPADKPADKPKPAEEAAPATEPKPETKPETRNEDEDDEVDVPFTLDFTPAIAGYTIETTKDKDSDETYAYIEMTISRSSMVKYFSVFVMVLMWGASLAVLFLVLSVVIGGRKVEIAMFSFIATLIFSFVAVRNAQPAVPPVGTLSDYIAFFGAEAVLALSLLTVLLTWLLRPAAK